MQKPDPRVAKAGYILPTFQRASEFDNWNRFAAVNDEFVAIHMNDSDGQAAGYPAAIGMGNLQWAYLHCIIRDWLGSAGRITSLECQFRAPSVRGGTVTAHAVVKAAREISSRATLELEVWTEDGGGTKLATGTATVELAP